MEGLKPVGAHTLTDNEGQEATNKEDSGQTLKPADKKPVQKQGIIWILRWSSQLQQGCSC